MLLFNLLLVYQLHAGVYPNSLSVWSEEKYNELIVLADSNLYSNPDKALYFCHLALGLANSENNNEAIVNAKIMQSRIYRKKSFFDLAFEVTCEAYNMCVDENSLLRAETCIEKALIYRMFYEKEKALRFANEACEIYQLKIDSLGLAESFNSIGLIYMGNNEKSCAFSYFNKALVIYEKLGVLVGVARELNNLTLVSDDYEQNVKFIKKAIRINESANNIWQLGENYNNLASQNINLKKYDKALVFLDVALNYINKINTTEFLLDNHIYRHRLYLKLENYKEAYQWLLKYYKLKNSMPSVRSLADVEMMIAERKILTQKRELRLKEQDLTIERQKKFVVIILLSTACLFFVFFVCVIRYRNKKNIIAQQLKNEKEKLKSETNYLTVKNELSLLESERQNNERALTNLVFHVKSRNDILNKIKEQIKDVYGIAPDNVKKELKKIGLFISQYHKKNNSLEKTISDIDNISTEYIARLKELHPDLTKNQIVLASLLRINMTSKEIALLIDSSTKTVNMARYRLRKQLFLDSDVSLSEYLKQV